MLAQKMDRGTEAMKQTLDGCQFVSVRQTRRGWFQECLGCEAKTEFKYFQGTGDQQVQFATSLEDTDCCCRVCCPPVHPFKMVVVEDGTQAEILSMDRPLKCAPAGCKCCCYQEMTFSSGGQELGKIEEQCFFCVPRFQIDDGEGTPIYKLHMPTCCGGCCVNCCTEGNPCFGPGCCKVPFHVFPATQEKTDGGAEHIGKILKKPKSLKTEIFTDANAFDIEFPESASSSEKAMLMGSAVFLNANFFEGGGGD